MSIANAWSTGSRNSHNDIYKFLGPEKEYLLQHCESESVIDPTIDYYIFGHRHLPIEFTLNNGKSKYINTGDWLAFQSYATMENGSINVQFFENPSSMVVTNDVNSWDKNKINF